MIAAFYATKKDLKASKGKELKFAETAWFPEFKPNGSFSVVGPSATRRNWYATVTMQDGLIKSVK